MSKELDQAKHMMKLYYKVAHRAQVRALKWRKRFRKLLQQELKCSSNSQEQDSSS